MIGSQQNHGFERRIEGVSHFKYDSEGISRDGFGPPELMLPEMVQAAGVYLCLALL